MQMSPRRVSKPQKSDTSGVSSTSGPKNALSRSGSEGWEVMPHADSACYSSRPSSERGAGADDFNSEARICLRLRLLEHGTVAVQITAAAADPDSPGQPTVMTSAEGGSGNCELPAATYAPSTSGSSCGGSPARSSQLSFEHLSDHFSPPSVIADDEESTPPSLPDLEDTMHDDLEDSSGFAVGVASPDGPPSEVPLLSSPVPEAQLPASIAASLHSISQQSDMSLGDQSISPLGSSFADVAGIGLANFPAVPGLPPSLVDCAIAQLQAGKYPLQQDEGESDGTSTQQAAAVPASGSNASGPSTGGDSASVVTAETDSASVVTAKTPASEAPANEVDAPHNKSSLAALQRYLAAYVPSDSLAVRLPSDAIAAMWKLLQDWGCCTRIVMGHCLEALPPPVAAQLRRTQARAHTATKHLQGDIGFLGAALGLSVTGLAVLSLLLASSYSTNWQLRIAMARKDDDIMKLVGQVLALQRNMFKPQRVQVRHLSSSCAFPDLGEL